MNALLDKHLIYKSRYRGMKELDLIFRAFQPHISTLAEIHKDLYARFLDETESDLYRWLMGGEPSPAEYEALVAFIRSVSFPRSRETSS